MGPDDTVCFCFRVPQRKIVHFIVREQPPCASLISECLSAGTGCGWCVPYLEELHRAVMAKDEPDALGAMSAADYEAQRGRYLKTGTREEEPPR